ncbi:unnamed protein product [Lactuca virosa]|uniref:Uncharacterized protein n=1 Tax=Lactuca virosa TaxID=75947 RepID=A0AAU9MG97_9ASTR|nr:unnamed protein product [Lactuca virosa]
MVFKSSTLIYLIYERSLHGVVKNGFAENTDTKHSNTLVDSYANCGRVTISALILAMRFHGWVCSGRKFVPNLQVFPVVALSPTSLIMKMGVWGERREDVSWNSCTRLYIIERLPG